MVLLVYQKKTACYCPRQIRLFNFRRSLMSIQYTTKVEDGTLFVYASGFDESLDEVQTYAMGVLTASQQHGVNRVLCDETDLEYRLGTFDTYQAGEFLSKHVPAVTKVAIVCNPRHLSDAQFFEDVVVNRGLTFRLFVDRETAMSWLFEPQASLDA